MSAPLDFDEILRQEEIKAKHSRLTARFAPLWAESDRALRTDVGLVIEITEMASAARRGERVVPLAALDARRIREARARGMSLILLSGQAEPRVELCGIARDVRKPPSRWPVAGSVYEVPPALVGEAHAGRDERGCNLLFRKR